MKVKVLTVDEREVVRLGFEGMIAQSGLCAPVGSCSTPQEALGLAISAPGAFDVALLGLQTSINHAPAVDRLIEAGVRIVLFRITSDPEFQRRAMGSGISAVVDPRTTSAELEMVLHGAVGAGVGKISAVSAVGTVRLSPRQREVLELYAMGGSRLSGSRPSRDYRAILFVITLIGSGPSTHWMAGRFSAVWIFITGPLRTAFFRRSPQPHHSCSSPEWKTTRPS